MPDAKPQPIPDNVSDPKEFVKMEDDGRRYRVMSDAVGAHRGGTVVSARQLGPGAEIQRLIDAGALAPLSDEEAKAARGEVEPAATVMDHREDPRFSTGTGAPAPAMVPAEQATDPQATTTPGPADALAIGETPPESDKPAVEEDKPAFLTSENPDPPESHRPFGGRKR